MRLLDLNCSVMDGDHYGLDGKQFEKAMPCAPDRTDEIRMLTSIAGGRIEDRFGMEPAEIHRFPAELVAVDG